MEIFYVLSDGLRGVKNENEKMERTLHDQLFVLQVWDFKPICKYSDFDDNDPFVNDETR